MIRSLSTHGQISPIVCLRRSGKVELIDGFKRLHSCRMLQWPFVQVRFLNMTMYQGKIEMVRLNRVSHSITPIEEMLIVDSLHRNDGLPVDDIAVLIGHNHRWVTRRCRLAEDLHDEIRHHLFQGLISAGIAWVLAQLPWGIQSNCLNRILKYRLSLPSVKKILRNTRASPLQPSVMDWPWLILESDEPQPTLSRQAWYRRLIDFNDQQRIMLAGAMEDLLPENEKDDHLLQETIGNSRKICSFLERQLRDDPPEIQF